MRSRSSPMLLSSLLVLGMVCACGQEGGRPATDEDLVGVYELSPEKSLARALAYRFEAAAEALDGLAADERLAAEAVIRDRTERQLSGLRVRLTLGSDGRATFPGGMGTWSAADGTVTITPQGEAAPSVLAVREGGLEGPFGGAPFDLVFTRLP